MRPIYRMDLPWSQQNFESKTRWVTNIQEKFYFTYYYSSPDPMISHEKDDDYDKNSGVYITQVWIKIDSRYISIHSARFAEIGRSMEKWFFDTIQTFFSSLQPTQNFLNEVMFKHLSIGVVFDKDNNHWFKKEQNEDKPQEVAIH